MVWQVGHAVNDPHSGQDGFTDLDASNAEQMLLMSLRESYSSEPQRSKMGKRAYREGTFVLPRDSEEISLDLATAVSARS